MPSFPSFSVALLLAFCAPAAGAAATIAPVSAEVAPPANVLFVGNSFTYYNNSLHNHYRRLLRASNGGEIAPGLVRIMTISNGRLAEHAGLEAMLESENWDVVVLQGHSLGPLGAETAGALRDAARKHAAAIRRAGARPLFFMTWAYTDRPEMTARIDAVYSSIGRELDAEVAPVGLAFAAVTRDRPDIRLRIEDKRHPTLAGTYLAACVFFAVLQGESPEGLDYDAGLGPAVANVLQRAAWQAVVAYRERDDAARAAAAVDRLQ